MIFIDEEKKMLIIENETVQLKTKNSLKCTDILDKIVINDIVFQFNRITIKND